MRPTLWVSWVCRRRCQHAFRHAVGSQLATLPITIPAFGTFSLIAPLANAVIGPVVSVLLAVSIVLVPYSLVAPLRIWALIVPMVAARCALFFEQLFAAVPGASVSVPPDSMWIYLVPCLLAVLLVWWPRPRARPMAVGLTCLVFLAAIPYAYWDRFAPPSVTVLDVGQADAILIRQGGHSSARRLRARRARGGGVGSQ